MVGNVLELWKDTLPEKGQETLETPGALVPAEQAASSKAQCSGSTQVGVI